MFLSPSSVSKGCRGVPGCCYGSVVSDSLPPHGLQHARFPCPSPSPGVCSNACPLSDAIQPSLSSPSPAFNLSSIRVFSNESALPIQWSKYWNFSISLCNEYSGLISFRNNWFDHLAVQGTLKSLLQHQFESINSTLSLLYCPALTFIHDYRKKHSCK